MSDFKDYDPPPMPDTSTVFSRTLRASRIGASITLRAAAAAMKISATELSDIESGRMEPSDALFRKMVAFYAEVRLGCVGRQLPDKFPIITRYLPG